MQTDTPNGRRLVNVDNNTADILKQRYNKFKSSY